MGGSSYHLPSLYTRNARKKDSYESLDLPAVVDASGNRRGAGSGIGSREGPAGENRCSCMANRDVVPKKTIRK